MDIELEAAKGSKSGGALSTWSIYIPNVPPEKQSPDLAGFLDYIQEHAKNVTHISEARNSKRMFPISFTPEPDGAVTTSAVGIIPPRKPCYLENLGRCTCRPRGG